MDSIFSMIKKSPTQMHFIKCARENLIEKGFVELKENEKWDNIPNHFFVVRSEETIIACNICDIESALIFATNLDYPCFKLKPNSGLFKNGAERINIQNYGYAMWFTWMDRDLSITGKVIIKDKDSEKQIVKLINIQTPLCTMPNLASHLTPAPKDNFNLKIEENMKPFISFIDKKDPSKSEPIQSPSLLNYIAKECSCNVSDIIDFDLYVISAEEPSTIGLNDEIYASQRISSILQASFAFDAFVNSNPQKGMTIFYGYDHENDISESFTGFDSNFLKETINRIGAPSSFYRDSLLLGGVRIPAAYAQPGYGVCYRNGILGECQPRFADLEKFLTELSKNGIGAHKCFATYDINCGVKEISVKLNISALYFGIPIYSLHSIRESAFLSDIISYYKSIQTFYNLNRE